MLHILPYTADWRDHPVLRAMFSARKRVFIDLLKWDLPVCDETFEVDRFDEAGAVYLILTAPDGSHRASTRLLPTDRPHILDSLFPTLCASPPPTGPAVREITRFCLERDLRARERRAARDELVSALADYALTFKVATYTGVAELPWFDQIMRFGWTCRALGVPLDLSGRILAGLRIDISVETPVLLAAQGIYVVPQIGGETRHAA